MAQKWVLDQPMMSMVNPNTGVPNSLYQDPASQLLAMLNKKQSNTLAQPIPVDNPNQVAPQFEQQVEAVAPREPNVVEPAMTQIDPQAAVMAQIRNMMNNPEEKANRNKMRELLNQSFEDQSKGIAENEQLLKNYQARGQQIDLSPLLALTDSWTGSNLSRGYQKPLSADEYAKQLLVLRNSVQNQKRDLVDKQIEALGSMGMSSKMLGPMMELARQGNQNDRFGTKFTADSEKYVMKTFDDVTRKMGDKGEALSKLDQVMSNPTSVTSKMVAGNIAKLIGGDSGALAEGDIYRALPPNLQDQMAELVTKLSGKDQPLTSGAIKAVRDVIEIARQMAKDRYNNELDSAYNSLNQSQTFSQLPLTNKAYDQKRALVQKYFANKPAKQASPMMSIEEWKKAGRPKR